MIKTVLSRYDLPVVSTISELGNAGGFSGARIWKIHTCDRVYCLRRWPKLHPDPQQLAFIHRVLVHAHANGCREVACPLACNNGQRFVQFDDHLWELTHWLQGRADFESNPSQSRLSAAIDVLRRFHLAAAQVHLDFRPSANVRHRINLLQQVPQLISEIDRFSSAAEYETLFRLREIIGSSGRAMARDCLAMLRPLAQVSLPVQPVIRDIWHDNLLFTGDRVTGLIDFGAMRIDCVSCDLARMLGSLVADDRPVVHDAVQQYAEIRPLSDHERQLIPLLDSSGILLGAINWMTWLIVDRRQFDAKDAVSRRLEFIRCRLEKLI